MGVLKVRWATARLLHPPDVLDEETALTDLPRETRDTLVRHVLLWVEGNMVPTPEGSAERRKLSVRQGLIQVERRIALEGAFALDSQGLPQVTQGAIETTKLK